MVTPSASWIGGRVDDIWVGKFVVVYVVVVVVVVALTCDNQRSI